MKGLDLFFPPRCVLCGELLGPGEKSVHAGCYRKLVCIKEPRCKYCGKPLESDAAGSCLDCERKRAAGRLHVDGGRAVWLYQGEIRESLMDFKYNGMRSYGEFYACEAVKYAGNWIEKLHPELLVPIPLHPRKKRIRGYNQAEVLAENLGKRLQIPVDSRVLLRKRWTDPLKSVSGTQRRHNLARAMALGNVPGRIRRIMLVDDIYTTGSTMEICSGLLKRAGIEKVFFLTICIGDGAK